MWCPALGGELEVPPLGRLMLIPLFQKHYHFTKSPTLSTLPLHVHTTFLAKPVAGNLARSPHRLACWRSALRQDHPRPEPGGWLQWQFNLRKVEFAGVSAYFYGHGHPAAELKTRSV